MLGYQVKERIPGIDIAVQLLEYAEEIKKSSLFIRRQAQVIEAMKRIMKESTVMPNWRELVMAM